MLTIGRFDAVLFRKHVDDETLECWMRKQSRDLLGWIGLIRVSTDLERQGNGAEAQKAQVLARAKREGATVRRWFYDEVTGGAGLQARAGLMEAIAELAATDAGVLAFQKWDRFGRADVFDTALAERAVTATGAKLLSADGLGNGDEPGNVLTKELMQSVARFEKAIIRQRIKAGLEAKRARGESLGPAPYGFTTEPTGQLNKLGRPLMRLVPEPAEQAVLAKVRELRAAGQGLQAIVDALASLGLRSRKGGRFSLSGVHAMLGNKRERRAA